jgi:hypothetical protein
MHGIKTAHTDPDQTLTAQFRDSSWPNNPYHGKMYPAARYRGHGDLVCPEHPRYKARIKPTAHLRNPLCVCDRVYEQQHQKRARVR